MNIRHFTQIAGCLIAFSFGSIYSALRLQRALNDALAENLTREGKSIFATLGRAQEINVLGRSRYYYSYSGMWKNRQFHVLEEVHPDLFYILSEGKNVQLSVFADPAGTPHTRIHTNRAPFGKKLDFLETFSLVMALAGGAMILVSFAVRTAIKD